MKSRRASEFTTEMKFKNHLQSIKATLVQAPTIDELMEYIPEFVSMTWLEDIGQIDRYMSDKGLTRHDLVEEAFARHTLPTALETIRVTFFLEGLDLTNVTHVIRHRMFSYSSQSSDPTSMEGHDILENDAFEEHPDLKERARKLCEDANELYKDALNRGMTFYDARHYMPRAKEAKYFMSGDVAQFMNFINTRLGRQNQPTSDNILALRMRQELLRLYPQLEKWMPVEQPQLAYISCINEKANLNTYPPDKMHKKKLKDMGVKWDKAEFKHPKSRDEYSCNDKFQELFSAITGDSEAAGNGFTSKGTDNRSKQREVHWLADDIRRHKKCGYANNSTHSRPASCMLHFIDTSEKHDIGNCPECTKCEKERQVILRHHRVGSKAYQRELDLVYNKYGGKLDETTIQK
jgi:thymidylate synthase ThyX